MLRETLFFSSSETGRAEEAMGASQSCDEPEKHHGESLTISFCTASRWKEEKKPPAQPYVSYARGVSRDASPLKSARSNSDAYKDIDYRYTNSRITANIEKIIFSSQAKVFLLPYLLVMFVARLPYNFNFPKFHEAPPPSPPKKAKPAATVQSITRFV